MKIEISEIEVEVVLGLIQARIDELQHKLWHLSFEDIKNHYFYELDQWVLLNHLKEKLE